MEDLTEVATRESVSGFSVSELSQRMLKRAVEETVPPGRSQLLQVAQDLCRSVCEAAVLRNDPLLRYDSAETFIEEQSERVRDILSAIPSAFHHFMLSTRDGRDMNPFGMNVSEMTEAAQHVTSIKPEDVIKAYGTVWTHVRALSEIRPDAKSKSKSDLCLHPLKDSVEHVADLYLAADDFVSPLLEWAIVDALVLDRITDFASVCAFTGNLPDTSDGQVIEGPLLPGVGLRPMGTKSPTPLAGLRIGLTEVAGKFGVELAALGVTWLLCELLAGSEGLAKWILFSGVTAGRWVSNAVRSNGPKAREKEAKGETNLRMLWDMGIAHDRIPAMNVGLLQHLLYRVEERGAAFNPSIYAILEKRARREPGWR